MRKSAPMDLFTKTLDGKVALVTGAGSGIGAATACVLARAGAKVGVLTRTPAEGRKVCRAIDEAGGESLFLNADVSSESRMRRAVQALQKRWHRLDIVVANAGINGVWSNLDQLKFSEWKETLGINLDGTFLTLKYTLPLLRKRGGAVVVISSVNGNRMFSNTGATAYCVTKAGQVALARMLALELAPQRIRVNTICPGAIATAIDDNTERRGLERKVLVKFPEGEVPLTKGQPGTAEQVAQLAWFLVSDLASHISGTEVYIDGAESLLRG